MQNFMSFLQEYEKVIDIIQVIFFFIISIMLYRKTGNVKYLTEALEEMKFRTASYNVTEKADDKTGEVKTEVLRASQSFNKLVPIYRLNKVTGELENTGEFVDIQEQIDSFKETALNSMLERFMPQVVDDTADLTQVDNDLDFLAESFDIAEEYRERFNLPDKMSHKEIFAHMKDYSVKLSEKLNVKNGGNEVEKKEIEQESE